MPDESILGDEAGWQGENVLAVSGCSGSIRAFHQLRRVRWRSECQQTGPVTCSAAHLWSGVAFMDKTPQNRRRVFHLRKHTDSKACFGFRFFFLLQSGSWNVGAQQNPQSTFIDFLKLRCFCSGSAFRIFTVKPEIERSKCWTTEMKDKPLNKINLIHN